MRLRTLIAADAAVFVIAAATFLALFPSNVDSHDQSPVYIAAFWVGAAALLILVVAALAALGRRGASSR